MDRRLHRAFVGQLLEGVYFGGAAANFSNIRGGFRPVRVPDELLLSSFAGTCMPSPPRPELCSSGGWTTTLLSRFCKYFTFFENGALHLRRLQPPDQILHLWYAVGIAVESPSLKYASASSASLFSPSDFPP